MKRFTLVVLTSILTITVSGCEKVYKMEDVPILSEPYDYDKKIDEFTGNSLIKATTMDLRDGVGLALTTTFGCEIVADTVPKDALQSSYFVFSLQTGQGESVTPSRIRLKLDDTPPVEINWNSDADEDGDFFAVPYAQVLASGASPSEQYSAAWVAGMTPHLNNAFALDLAEPEGALDFDKIKKQGVEALSRKAREARRLMIRYTLSDGTEDNIEINLDDVAIRTALTECGYQLHNVGNKSTIPENQRITFREFQQHSSSILIFTNSARMCLKNVDPEECSGAVRMLQR